MTKLAASDSRQAITPAISRGAAKRASEIAPREAASPTADDACG
ncbi:hypothetical protein C7443_102517 [Plasticicumulans acidivorans]|uniref:Uncharacterized protein n=1 Tax=Plasticicumulans acidivorans TaxID=886464 RepID=A0A317MYY9_9GAMM|nr:hypothetical protein C7443_102517 [Plasticicumulans acidivorans]